MRIFTHSSGKIKELTKNEFESEKILQVMMQENLDSVFEGLEFLTSEFSVEHVRLDTVAFDTEKNCFVIIEYKNIKNKQVLDQGATYYRMLMDQKDSFVLLYNKIKNKQYTNNDFNWDEPYVIFLSPEFTKWQVGASGIGLPIRLFIISYYENNILALEQIERQLNDKLTKINDSTNKPKNYVRLDEYDEEKYLNGEYKTGNASDETRKLYLFIKDVLLKKFERLEIRIRKVYVGFYNKDNDTCICTLDVRKSSIKLSYATTVKKGILSSSDFIRDVEKIGIYGIGHYQSKIKNKEDFDKALPFIQKVYDHRSPS